MTTVDYRSETPQIGSDGSAVDKADVNVGLTDATPVYRLPDELLAAVFRLLDTRTLLISVPAVCKRWSVVVGSLRNFRFKGSAVLNWGGTTRLEEALESAEAQAVLGRLVARVSHVTSLDLTHCYSNAGDVLTAVVAECPNLTEFICGCSMVDVPAVVAAIPKMPLLEVANFDQSSDPSSLDDAVANALAAHCPRLRVARFSDSSVSDNGLAALVRGCPHLVEASFGHGWDTVSARTFDGLQVGLTTFDLWSCTSEDLAAVLRRFPLLERVALNYCYDVDDTVLDALGDLGPRLTEVKISSAHDLSDAGVITLAEHCPRLTVADFGWCGLLTDESLFALACDCPLLRRVNFERTQITDVGVGALGRQCRRLCHVVLDECRGWVTDEAVLALIYGCPRLERLSVQGTRITDVTLDALTTCAALRQVCVIDCHYITLRGLTALVEGCPQLEICTFGWGHSVTLAEHESVFTEETREAIATEYFFCQLESAGLILGLVSNLDLWTFRRFLSVEMAVLLLCFCLGNWVMILLFLAVINAVFFAEATTSNVVVETCEISPWAEIERVCHVLSSEQ